jgi:hypothetical protein
MLRLVGWIATIAALTFLVWQTVDEDPLWPTPISAVALVLVSILTGMRIGADSAAAYIRDVQRTNHALADQNHELRQANEILLKEVASQSTAPSELA